MDLRFHSFGAKNNTSWNPYNNIALLKNLKDTAKDTHIFIDAPLNHSDNYKKYNFNTRKDIEQCFDVIWESPVCINNGYSLKEPRNIVLVCKVKKEFQ